MKKTMMLLIIGTLLVAGAGTGIVSAQTDEAQTGYGWYGPMYNWMADHMRGFGYGMGAGYCAGSGYYAPYADNVNDLQITVATVEDALEIAEEEIDADVSENNIYQMGRWWVVYYTDDDGTIKEARIDAFTGEVIKDFNDLRYQQAYQPRNNGRSSRGMGYGMMYGY